MSTTDTGLPVDALATVPMFARLSDSQLDRLARKSTQRDFAAGTTIVREGDTSMSLYVILSGAVSVERPRSTGGVVTLGQLGAGDAFGEMGLIEDAPRSATVVASEDTRCALLAKWDFDNEIREDPEIAIALLPVLAGRVRDLNDRLRQASVES